MAFETETVGFGVTVTDTVWVLPQPLVVPVTVYPEVAEGLTESVLVVAPVFQLYVVAPLAIKVVVCPAQIVALDTDTVGLGITVTDTVLVSEQVPLYPVTV